MKTLSEENRNKELIDLWLLDQKRPLKERVWSYRKLGAKYKISHVRVSQIVAKEKIKHPALYKVVIPPPFKEDPNLTRNENIRLMAKAGVKQATLSREYGVSRQRIQQIINYIPPVRLRVEKPAKPAKPAKLPKLPKICLLCKTEQAKGKHKYCVTCTTKYLLDKLEGRERSRMLVRVRDNFTCQICGKKWIQGQRHFDVHHAHPSEISGFSRKYDRHSTHDQLVTLCHKCHLRLHHNLDNK